MEQSMSLVSADRDILLWLDDKRWSPSVRWTWVKTAEEAIELLKTKRVRFASLDHDLAPEHYPWHRDYDPKTASLTSGSAVVKFLERETFHGNWAFNPPDGIRVHSMNPFGASDMVAGIKNIYDRNFQWDAESPYEVLPWQLFGQPSGWYSTYTTSSMRVRYSDCPHY